MVRLVMLLVALPCFVAADPNVEIERLKHELLAAANRDSIRFQLAIAYRDRGTIDDRTRAMQLFDEIRHAYWDDPEYHRQVAATLIQGPDPTSTALRESLERLLELEPEDVESRLTISRLLLKRTLRYFVLSWLGETLDYLDAALAVEPANRDALFLKSLCLQLARGEPGTDLEEKSRAARECTRAILLIDRYDLEARLLHAVHTLELGEIEDADRLFREAFTLMAPETCADFFSPVYVARDDELAAYHALEPEARSAFLKSYWLKNDPTPLTPVNENQLEYWKRMTLADFYFGDPERGVAGWLTDPGEVFVRYGPPGLAQFVHGYFEGSDVRSAAFPEGMRGGKAARLPFVHPSWLWRYDFRNEPVELTFFDIDLHGTFKADAGTQVKLGALRRKAPIIYHKAFPGEITRFYVSGVGSRGLRGRTREQVALCVASPGVDRVEIEITDVRTGERLSRKRRVAPEDRFEPVSGAEIVLLAETFELEPGRYTLAGYVDEADTRREGSFDVPLVVRPYATSELQISDIELALGLISGPARFERLGRSYLPNPMSLVGDDRNLSVYYEIYNLVPDAAHIGRFRARYTVVPSAYAREYAEQVRTGDIPTDDPIRLGGVGVSLGEVTLTRENYTDVTFSDETVRITGGGRQPKGAQVDVSRLEPGEYAVLVTVTDLNTSRSVTTHAPFRIVADAEMRALLGGD